MKLSLKNVIFSCYYLCRKYFITQLRSYSFRSSNSTTSYLQVVLSHGEQEGQGGREGHQKAVVAVPVHLQHLFHHRLHQLSTAHHQSETQQRHQRLLAGAGVATDSAWVVVVGGGFGCGCCD